MKHIFIKSTFYSLIFLGFCFCNTKQTKPVKNKINISDSITVKKDLNKHFENCQVEGSIALFDRSQQKWTVTDSTDYKKVTLPASTFKIINLLIALETGVVKNENEIIKWPGKTDTVKYGYRPEIYHNMTVRKAFEVSAGWVFIELAKKIGKDNYKHYLHKSQYGNGNISLSEDDFWNFGDFGISPLNQVQFLNRLYEYKLPFSKKNIDIVKNVMIAEKKDDYTISAKTGWTRDKGLNTGWWVGYVENGKGTFFFATRLVQDRKNNAANFGQCRKDITKSILKELEIIK